VCYHLASNNELLYILISYTHKPVKVSVYSKLKNMAFLMPFGRH